MLEGNPIPVLKPRAGGQQFVVYGDSCSGVADGMHAKNFSQVNAAIRALTAPPQFICFLGDEIMGLSADEAELRRQWQHFFEQELLWLDRAAIPLYHTTGNHTLYDSASEAVFREAMAHLPQNGPRGLSYFVRRGDLLMIFVNTMDERCGGEGTVETEWLEDVLSKRRDAKYKLVFGHHPVWGGKRLLRRLSAPDRARERTALLGCFAAAWGFWPTSAATFSLLMSRRRTASCRYVRAGLARRIGCRLAKSTCIFCRRRLMMRACAFKSWIAMGILVNGFVGIGHFRQRTRGRRSSRLQRKPCREIACKGRRNRIWSFGR